jgi:hypothetical protein
MRSQCTIRARVLLLEMMFKEALLEEDWILVVKRVFQEVEEVVTLQLLCCLI